MTVVRPVCLLPRRLSLLLALYRLSRPAPYGLGYPPNYRELMCETGITTTSIVAYNLRVLERDGYITAPPFGQDRSWAVNHDRLMFRTEAGVTSAWRYE